MKNAPPADFYEVRIKVFFEGKECTFKETCHQGGEYILDMLADWFFAAEENDHLYTVVVFKNGIITNTSEQVSARTMKETLLRLCPYLDG